MSHVVARKQKGRVPKHINVNIPTDADAVRTQYEATRVKAVEHTLQEIPNGRTVADVAREMGVPTGTLRAWLVRDEETYQRYVKAREMQGTSYAEKAVEIADSATNADVGVARLRVDTYRWFAARANSREWGDRQFVKSETDTTLRVLVEEEDAVQAVATIDAPEIAVREGRVRLPRPEATVAPETEVLVSE